MKERKTVFKWFWVWNFEKEEKWLNEMALSGWALDGVGIGFFHFIACEPGEYTIRTELHGFDDAYFSFLKEMGVEYVGRVFQWVYFRKKTTFGEFELFSDIDSKIKHLNRIARVIWCVGVANLVIGVINSWNPLHIGWMNLLCATLLMYALGRIQGKKEALEKDRELHE